MKTCQKRTKRVLDIVGAALGLVIVSPVLAAVAVAVWATMGRPILFRQERPGLGGKPFAILKFRTMRAPRKGEREVHDDNQRLTRLGRLLRQMSLDELPGLWNVLRGDMSLVGPRPLMMEYLDRYTPEQKRRHEVKPGITGWAQVNGRNAVRWEEKFELDVSYVDHWSLWLDCRILMMTAVMVFTRKGVHKPGYATTDPFEAAPRRGES